MRQAWMKGLLMVAWLAASPLVLAAGFDCKQAKGAVEQRICEDSTLSQLDGQMSQSFAQASIRAGQHMDALLRDQRNWLAQRNAGVAESAGRAAVTYGARITFLDHLFREPDRASPLLSAIAAHMVTAPSAAKGRGRVIGGWAFLGGDGTVFTMATEQGFDAAKSLPFDFSEVKNLIADPDDVSGNSMLALLDRQHLGGTYITQGTEDGVSWALFSWHGHAVQAVATPETLARNSWTTIGGLAEYQGKAYALQNDDGWLDASDLEAQPYLGDHWGDPVRLVLHYDVQLLLSSSYCIEANCAELTALANKIVSRYDRSHDADAVVENVSKDEQEKFNVLRQEARNLSELPDFDGQAKYAGDSAYTTFGGETYFPVRWHGELLLGRIGHATLGWRVSEDWLLAIWRWDGHAFVPVLGMVRQKQRGGFLLSAWLPVKPYTPH